MYITVSHHGAPTDSVYETAAEMYAAHEKQKMTKYNHSSSFRLRKVHLPHCASTTGGMGDLRHHHSSSLNVINSLVILHVIVTCLLKVEILLLDREGFLVVPTSVSSDGNERGF